jgi:hypothetical protein
MEDDAFCHVTFPCVLSAYWLERGSTVIGELPESNPTTLTELDYAIDRGGLIRRPALCRRPASQFGADQNRASSHQQEQT